MFHEQQHKQNLKPPRQLTKNGKKTITNKQIHEGSLTKIPLTSKSCGDFPLPGHFFEPKITSTPRNINMVD